MHKNNVPMTKYFLTKFKNYDLEFNKYKLHSLEIKF